MPHMAKESERRVARNEDLFRQVNEAIERGLWPGEEHSAVRFRCECAQLDCARIVELALRDYERVRASPSRFVMIPGHQLPEFETVIEDRTDYLVVEKRGGAAEIAKRLDPRDED
jgi:hypothetical protein